MARAGRWFLQRAKRGLIKATVQLEAQKRRREMQEMAGECEPKVSSSPGKAGHSLGAAGEGRARPGLHAGAGEAAEHPQLTVFCLFREGYF